MTQLARSDGASGALFDLEGTWPINATISEDIYFLEAGSPMTLTGLDFKLTLRCRAEDDSATYTLSTDDGTLAIAQDSNSNYDILRVTVDPGTFSIPGDMIADLASKDSSDVVTLWAHGTITLRKNPVSWS
jgi:hypothetical protein